ncbi:CYTH domain-containing protein [Ureibacillus thermosphaericus]|uniref:CYTH domain-containing protein n=1 Tax=Ureibacillus thermosphaericus TaxID=51173 RepID=UPI0003051A0B|nr:CYTH domain-containing protein [Ureibacillus thermosphaericus]
MSQQYEIEFKNMLTKEQYEQLLTEFNIQKHQIVRQVNHYFDTENWHLRKFSSALRIREQKRKYFCTLKEKTAKHIHLETTDILTQQQRDDMLSGKGFWAPSVKERLLRLQVPIEDLRPFGTLTTDRAEVPYEGGILVFDHSFYLHCDDYEVEYETNNPTVGEKRFLSFLQERNIDIQIADKKIARFMKAVQEKGVQ